MFFASIFTISAHFYLEAWNSLVCICSCANSLEVNLITKLSPVSLQLHENEYLRFLLYKRTIDCDLPINSLPRSRVCVVTQRSSPSIRTLKRSVAWQGKNGFVAWLAYQGQGNISVFPKDAITFSCFRTLKHLYFTYVFNYSKTLIYCVTVVPRSGSLRSWKFRHRTCAQANENKFTDLYFSNKTMKFYSLKCLVNVNLILEESFNPWEVCPFSEICRSLTGRGFVYFNWGILRSV